MDENKAYMHPSALPAILTQKHLIESKLAGKEITLGFDGFVDSIVRVVKARDDNKTTYFESSQELAHYILEKGNNSFAFELEERVSKLGGNMPITANAFRRLGLGVSCIGSLGLGDLHRVFKPLQPHCRIFSFAEPGTSTAMEFRNNKVMMAEMRDVSKVNWKTLLDVIGLHQLRELFAGRDLMCVLNWSEMEHASNIWRGLLADVLPATQQSPLPYGYFDFSDCSRKSNHQILEAMALLSEFARYWRVVLGLNVNEAEIIYRAMGGAHRTDQDRIRVAGDWIFSHSGLTHLVIHHATAAVCWSAQGICEAPNTRIEKPVILTGAGDNFNAGFCLGLLLDLEPSWCLKLAHQSSRFYLLHGESISLDAISAWVRESSHVSVVTDAYRS